MLDIGIYVPLAAVETCKVVQRRYYWRRVWHCDVSTWS